MGPRTPSQGPVFCVVTRAAEEAAPGLLQLGGPAYRARSGKRGHAQAGSVISLTGKGVGWGGVGDISLSCQIKPVSPPRQLKAALRVGAPSTGSSEL